MSGEIEIIFPWGFVPKTLHQGYQTRSIATREPPGRFPHVHPVPTDDMNCDEMLRAVQLMHHTTFLKTSRFTPVFDKAMLTEHLHAFAVWMNGEVN